MLGAFSQLTPGNWASTAPIGGLDWTYKASTGVLTAVPEPTTWALLAGSLLMVLGCRRRA